MSNAGKQNLGALYFDRTEFGIDEFEKVLQALLWTADYLFVPTLLRPVRDMPKDQENRILYQLHELAEAGLIRTYRFERSVPSHLQSDWFLLPESGTYTIPNEAYEELFERVAESTAQYRLDVNKGFQSGRRNIRLDGITEYVTLQDSLWALGLSGTLGTAHLLQAPASSQRLSAQLNKVRDALGLMQPAIRELMNVNDIPRLGGISTDSILTLRKKMPTVRQYLINLGEAVEIVNPLASADEKAVEIARRARLDYIRLLAENQASAGKRLLAISVDALAGILGLFYPILGVAPFVRPLAEWVKETRGDRQFVAFNVRLKRAVDV